MNWVGRRWAVASHKHAYSLIDGHFIEGANMMWQLVSKHGRQCTGSHWNAYSGQNNTFHILSTNVAGHPDKSKRSDHRSSSIDFVPVIRVSHGSRAWFGTNHRRSIYIYIYIHGSRASFGTNHQRLLYTCDHGSRPWFGITDQMLICIYIYIYTYIYLVNILVYSQNLKTL